MGDTIHTGKNVLITVPSNELNSTTTVLLQGWLLQFINHEY